MTHLNLSNLTETQARVLQEALDLYLRIGMFQLDAVLRVLDHPARCKPLFDHPKAEPRACVSALIDSIFARPGLPPDTPRVSISGGPGINNPIVHNDFKVAYDIERAIRSAKGENGTPPLHLGSEPLPLAQIVPA